MTTISNYEITLNIAGLITSLQTRNELIASKLRQRYGAFIDKAVFISPHLKITIQATTGAYFIPVSPGNWIIETSYQDNNLAFKSYREQGTVSFEKGIGYLEMDPQSDIENFLRAVYARLCLDHSALLLHASGMVRDGLGYAFFGHSGAGKTTITRLSEEFATILSDDMVIIRCHNQDCTIHGVPFRGEYGDPPRANQYAPLKGVFRLWQSTNHAIQYTPRSVAVAELSSSSPFIAGHEIIHEQLLKVCNRIVKQTTVQSLQFRKDKNFWNAIDEYYTTFSQTSSANGGASH